MSVMKQLLRFVLAANCLFVLVLAFSYQFWRPDSGAPVVAALALIPIALSTAGAMALIAIDWTPY